ncbi:hypothetical protein J4E83_008741 [Alternaria metachromatica]|uniref:uncharacterized protein n=1 Tax=Alternaria metachromatica TaxID=283354 RepID=UPI0020C42FAB|nr:uncharacterized protein J4E83_008741 [Alternaria metachromatica]KAI4609571.1 hypothetical protein J4E83_008741 [Alternaria metachromatica]
MSPGTAQAPSAPSWMSLKNLLHIIDKNEHLKPPTADSERVEHAGTILDSKLGCDILLDSNGILFPIHSAWALGGPSADWMLQCLFQDRPCDVPFPAFSPIIVDRFVNYLYLGTYQRHVETEVSNIAHAENKPDAPYKDFTEHMKSVQFHLEVIKFGEFLKYRGLINAAYTKLFEQLISRGRFGPASMKGFVDWMYGADKICKDEGGLLQQLIVAAVIAHEQKFWEQHQSDEFLGLVQNHADFLEHLKTAKELHKTLSGSPSKSQKNKALKRKHRNSN